MCLPAAPLALIATAVSAAGAGYSALTANAQARGAAAQAEVNRTEANRSAADAIARGDVEQQRVARARSAEMAAQRAAMAANGLDTGFGSAADYIGDTSMYAEEDAAVISENTMREVRGFETQGANFGAEAKSQKLAATGALVGGALKMGSSIIGGAEQYRKLRKPPSYTPGGFNDPARNL